jgi:hypothetical protein
MKKQLRLITRSRMVVDQWSKTTYPMPAVPRYVFSRHLRRRAKYQYENGTVIIDLANGWYVHSFRNGVRILCALPF